MRAEPVVFVRDGYDMVPYSLRHKDKLSETYFAGSQTKDISEFEVEIRKEVCDLLYICLLAEYMLLLKAMIFDRLVIKSKSKSLAWLERS